MQILALISVYSAVVIIVVAVITIVVSFFWVFVPLPRAMGWLHIRFWLCVSDDGGCSRSSRALSLHEMDINKMLAELRAEREQVEEAIIVLERLARGQGKRRGRPPAWMTTVKRRGRPPGSKNKTKSTDV